MCAPEIGALFASASSRCACSTNDHSGCSWSWTTNGPGYPRHRLLRFPSSSWSGASGASAVDCCTCGIAAADVDDVAVAAAEPADAATVDAAMTGSDYAGSLVYW